MCMLSIRPKVVRSGTLESSVILLAIAAQSAPTAMANRGLVCLTSIRKQHIPTKKAMITPENILKNSIQ